MLHIVVKTITANTYTSLRMNANILKNSTRKAGLLKLLLCDEVTKFFKMLLEFNINKKTGGPPVTLIFEPAHKRQC